MPNKSTFCTKEDAKYFTRIQYVLTSPWHLIIFYKIFFVKIQLNSEIWAYPFFQKFPTILYFYLLFCFCSTFSNEESHRKFPWKLIIPIQGILRCQCFIAKCDCWIRSEIFAKVWLLPDIIFCHEPIPMNKHFCQH